jgi:drug/metabolite transporter (DMT)-like permease
VAAGPADGADAAAAEGADAAAADGADTAAAATAGPVAAPALGIGLPEGATGSSGRALAGGPGAGGDRGRLADYATLGLLTLIWSTTWAAIRIGLRGIPPFTGVALRFGIGAVALLAVARSLGVRLRGAARPEDAALSLPPVPKVSPRAPEPSNGASVAAAPPPGPRPSTTALTAAPPASPWRVWLVNAALTFCLPYGAVYWAEQWVPSGLAAVLFATSPLWVALAAHLALPGERLRAPTVAGVLIGFAGVAAIFSEDLRALGGPRVAGAAAVLLIGPFSAAVGVVAVKRWAAGMHPLSVAAVPMALTCACMGCVAWVVERGQPLRLDASSVGALLYLALCGSALSFALYFWLLARLPATTLSLINYLTPVVALLIGGSALGESFTARTLAGSALVVGGVAVAMRARGGGAAAARRRWRRAPVRTK